MAAALPWRVLGKIVDLVLAGLVTEGLGRAVTAVAGVGAAQQLTAAALGTVVLVGYLAIAETRGTTAGKWLARTRVRADGTTHRPGLRAALLRNAYLVIVFAPTAASASGSLIGATSATALGLAGILGFGALAASIARDPDARGWHDRLAGTSVVRLE